MTDTYGKSSNSSKLFPGKRSHRSANWSLGFPWVVFESRGFWFRYPQHTMIWAIPHHFFRKKHNFTQFLGNSTQFLNISYHLMLHETTPCVGTGTPSKGTNRWTWQTFFRILGHAKLAKAVHFRSLTLNTHLFSRFHPEFLFNKCKLASWIQTLLAQSLVQIDCSALTCSFKVHHRSIAFVDATHQTHGLRSHGLGVRVKSWNPTCLKPLNIEWT